MRNMWKNTDSKVLMEQKREYNNSFDLVKFWCSYIVISIHSGLRNGITPPISQIVNLVQYMAVPIFYVISGYLLGCKLYGANKANSWHSSVKTLSWQIKLYVIWAVLFLPINLYGEFFVYKHNVCQSVVSLLQGWFLVGENYDSWPLWYLLSSIVGMGLILFCYRLGIKKMYIVLLSIVVYAVGMVVVRLPREGFVGSLQYMMSYIHGNRNGFFFGWAFLAVGLLGKLSIKRQYVYTLFMFLLIVGLFKPHYVRLPLAFICLQLMLIHKKKGNPNVYRFLRKMSTLNYFMHMLFVFLFIDLLGVFLQDVWLFIAVAVVTTIASCCLILGRDRFYAYKSLG